MTASGRVLDVTYETADRFRQDYDSNLSNGGVFVATDASLDLRDSVTVRVHLVWRSKEVELVGEVVHIVPPEMREVGGTPGVAIQFRESALAIRDRLSPLLVDVPTTPVADTDHGARRAVRKQARVQAHLDSGGARIEGRTRDLSRGGVLVSVSGESPAALGDPVRVALRHPTSGEELDVAGRVVREVETEGRVSAVAVEFTPSPNECERVEAFVDDVQRAEHTRRLGGISGPIDELGPHSIVQMFATTAPVGTIILRNDQQEGVICFESGLMRLARVGGVMGMKALVRMLAWTSGSFEFHARIEEQDISDPPFPLDAAVLDAVRQIDEGARINTARFPLQARLVAVAGSDPSAAGQQSKVEAALLDLAGAGFTVQRALELIPEPDPEIFKALESLVDEELLELR